MVSNQMLVGAVGLMLFTVGSIAAPALPKDVPPAHWAASSVARVMSKKIMTPSATGNFDGNKTVTRYELAIALDRMVQYIESGQTPLQPAPREHAPAKSSAETDGENAIAHLQLGGYLRKTSPLLAGNGNQSITANELAQALTQVTIRVSDKRVPSAAP